MNLNKLRDEAYQNAIEHGWHENELSDRHWIMLIISELAEAVQADRSERRANKDLFLLQINSMSEYLRNDIKPKITSFYFREIICDTLEDELADVIIRIFDFAGLHNINLDKLPNPFILQNSDADKSLKDEIERMTMTEFSFKCTDALIACYNAGICYGYLQIVMHWIYLKTLTMGINIEWFIEQKMEFNKTRPYKHGKKY